MLNDGYYLSIYSDIDPILNMLNFSLRHDHNIALFKKEKEKINLVHHWELERITGIKHHNISFFSKEDLIDFINEKLLSTYNLTLEDMESTIGIPELSTNDKYYLINEENNISYHSISHLFTSLIMDSEIFNNSTIIGLAVDGGSDSVIDKDLYNKHNFCGCVSRNGKVELFGIPSMGMYWTYVSEYFEKPEGTLMALAYATTTDSSISFELLPNYYGPQDRNKCDRAIRSIIDKIMNEDFMNDKSIINYDNRFTLQENKISVIMKILQKQSIIKITKLVESIIKKYEINPRNAYLSLSGGYALNCPTNSALMNHFNFKGFLSCPCVNDGGLAIGMAMYYFYKELGSFNYKFETAYYGDEYNNLSDVCLQYEKYIGSVTEQPDIKTFINDITAAPIIWFDGRAEVGPRALGHRSIIGLANKKSTKDLLNTYKKREWWRPVAPIVLEEYIYDWFDNSFPSKYMLNNFVANKKNRELISAVLHFDNTARVQTLNENENPLLFKYLEEVYRCFNIPIICNTSLNDKGEPIIDKIEEAINFALRKRIKVLYVNGNRLELKNFKKYRNNKPLCRENSLFKKYKFKHYAYLNPFNVSKVNLLLYKTNSNLSHLSLNNIDDVNRINKVCKIIIENSRDQIKLLIRKANEH